ncbi:hypothetical protein AVEN_2089-1 [Araneus ventricosus]|uniref:Uncharacterized protein n=1 Tax=Araneus ventricosus TaxID=182803 RepID=A0A4Y2IFE2_ARAVE|nr:hypothetical protein AVEN_2089-1 [Araneus ventricosus]
MSLMTPGLYKTLQKKNSNAALLKLLVKFWMANYSTLKVQVRLTSRFEATQRLFRDEPRNFEPLSDDEDDTQAGTPSPNFRTTPMGRRLATYV